jgi:hypothetical protein
MYARSASANLQRDWTRNSVASDASSAHIGRDCPHMKPAKIGNSPGREQPMKTTSQTTDALTAAELRAALARVASEYDRLTARVIHDRERAAYLFECMDYLYQELVRLSGEEVGRV